VVNTGRAGRAEVAVDASLKGTVDSPTIEFRFLVPDLSNGFGRIPSNLDRIVFLVRRGDHFELANPYYPSLPALRGIRPNARDPLASVIMYIAAIVDSEGTSGSDKREAIGILRHQGAASPSPAITASLTKALGNPDSSVSGDAAAALLSMGDVDALPVAERILSSDIAPEVKGNLHGAIARDVKNKGAVPALGRLLKSPDPETRRAAAAALRRVKTPEALRDLAGALDDSDLLVQYSAVIALAEANGGRGWGPSLETFQADPAAYVKHWKEWSAAQAKQ
jgi:hypothetical protein